MPPTNRKKRADERRRQEGEQSTLIIPQITPELLEERRRQAEYEERRRQAEMLQIARPETPEQEAPQPAPVTKTVRVPRRPRITPVAEPEQPAAPPEPKPAPQPEPKPAPQPVKRTDEKPRPTPRTRAEAEAELQETVVHDHIWLNNPLFVRGLGLAAVVAAATDADNALMLSAAALLMITGTRVLAVSLCHLTRNRFRPVIYCYAAALCYIPAYIVLYQLFGNDLSVLGIYLPLLAVDPAVIKRAEFEDLESIPRALRLGLNNGVGVALATMVVGVLRELLATGTVFDQTVIGRSLLPLAGQVSGGFLLVGLLAAVWIAVRDLYVNYKQEEVRRLYGKRKRRS